MQGLAFWLGYEHERFRHHPLTEGAIIGEFARLLESQNGVRTHLEKQYKELVRKEHVRGGERTDVVFTLNAPSNQSSNAAGKSIDAFAFPDGVIEVKRASASMSDIVKDIERLANLHRCTAPESAPNTFLLLT